MNSYVNIIAQNTRIVHIGDLAGIQEQPPMSDFAPEPSALSNITRL